MLARDKAVALRSVELVSFPLSSQNQKTSKKCNPRLPLLGAQHERDSVKNKPANLLVVSLGKALNGMPTSLCGRQVLGPSSIPAVVAQSPSKDSWWPEEHPTIKYYP